jgi:hypothetical protein
LHHHRLLHRLVLATLLFQFWVLYYSCVVSILHVVPTVFPDVCHLFCQIISDNCWSYNCHCFWLIRFCIPKQCYITLSHHSCFWYPHYMLSLWLVISCIGFKSWSFCLFESFQVMRSVKERLMWSLSFWKVGDEKVQGLYVAKLVRSFCRSSSDSEG